jgi:predicted nucleic acid-binding protein
MIVVDASALLEVLLRKPGAKAADGRMFEPGQTLHVPHLLDVEIAQVIRRFAINREIDDDRARIVLADLSDLPLRRYRHDYLLPRVWELRNNLSAYYAVYVALAEMLDAPLLTHDRRLASAASDRVQVELV